MKYRENRINDSVARTVGDIFRSVKDPRISSGFVTVNAAVVSKDLKFAKIYYGVLAGDPQEVQKGLKSASGFIRRELALRLNLRITPELTFVADSSITYGAHIASILNNLEISEPEDEESENDDGEF